jgi:plastocyanin
VRPRGLQVATACAAAAAAVVASQPGQAETIKIEIAKLAFSPAQVSAHVGDTIEWTNEDVLVHTATGRNHEWDVTIPAKGAGRTVLTKPGKIDYFCRYHPNMKGEITIEGK